MHVLNDSILDRVGAWHVIGSIGAWHGMGWDGMDVQTLIGGAVSESGDDAASIREARQKEHGQESLQPATLAKDLVQGLEVSQLPNQLPSQPIVQ